MVGTIPEWVKERDMANNNKPPKGLVISGYICFALLWLLIGMGLNGKIVLNVCAQ